MFVFSNPPLRLQTAKQQFAAALELQADRTGRSEQAELLQEALSFAAAEGVVRAAVLKQQAQAAFVAGQWLAAVQTFELMYIGPNRLPIQSLQIPNCHRNLAVLLCPSASPDSSRRCPWDCL